MKSITATTRGMSDDELRKRALDLRREIPAAQSLLDAIKREQRRRQFNAKKKGTQ